METQFILTPFFLDRPERALQTLARADWVLNEPQLALGDAQSRMGVIHRALADHVVRATEAGQVPVSIAGDCCAAIGVAAGLQRVASLQLAADRRSGGQPFLIWLDAHGDFNTWDTTPSGFLGGMPLAMIAGMGDLTMAQAVGLRRLEPEDILLTDGRDLDPEEHLLVDGSGITHLHSVMDLLDYPLPLRPLHVHFDVDVINPEDAPAMSYAVPGGPRANELAQVLHYLAGTGQIAAVSVSTWNPELDRDRRTRQVCLDLLDVLLGRPAHSAALS